MTTNPTIQVSENRTLTITMAMPEAQLEASSAVESNESFLIRMAKVIMAAVAIRKEHCYKRLLEHLFEVTYDGYAIRWKGGHFSPHAFEAMETVLTQLGDRYFDWLNHRSYILQVLKALATMGKPKEVEDIDWERLLGLLTEGLMFSSEETPIMP